MTIKHTIVKLVSVDSIMQEVDDAIDVKTMSRAEAMEFLRAMLIQVELRMGWVRDAMREEKFDAEDDIRKSVGEGFRAIRERKAKGGPGWGES
jgi:hypothetical protein